MKKACVIGHPVAHSRSPSIHQHWIQERGLDAAYERLDVTPENLESCLQSLQEKGYSGANVTLPHKENAARLCSSLTQTARSLGAVNTLWFEGDQLIGGNTDVEGFLNNLDDRTPQWDVRSGKAVVLGAGGAARAVVFALLQRGFSTIVIANRSLERAEALATNTQGFAYAVRWEERHQALKEANLLVNATSLGMQGQPSLEIDIACLPSTAVVCDLVYVPLKTNLLSQAAGYGCRIADGLGMLLHQAVPGFERWFGAKPVVTEALRQKIEDSLRS